MSTPLEPIPTRMLVGLLSLMGFKSKGLPVSSRQEVADVDVWNARVAVSSAYVEGFSAGVLAAERRARPAKKARR